MTTLAYRTSPAVGESGREFVHLFDARNVGFNVRSIKLKFNCPFDLPGTQGIDINHVSLEIPENKFEFTLDSANALVLQRGTFINYQGDLYCQGEEFEHALPTVPVPPDLRPIQRLTFKVTLAHLPSTATARLRLYFRGGGDRAYTDEVLCVAGTNEVSVDLTTLPPDLMGAVTHIGFQVVGDIETGDMADPANMNPSSPVLTIGDLVNAGSLTPGLQYTYKLVEIKNVSSYTNLIESDGSDSTNDITPTETLAMGQVFLPGRTNHDDDEEEDNPNVATDFALYRFGGAFADGYGRLVCVIPYGADDFDFGGDDPKGTDPAIYAPANPWVKFKAPTATGGAGGEIIDSTPDSFLLYAPLYQPGRSAPPEGIRDICEFQGRIWALANTNELHGSWLLSQDSNAGLYFTRVPAINDPAARIKGFLAGVGTDNNDRAQRLLPHNDRLVITMQRTAPFILSGTEPTNFELRPFLTAQGGVGHIAPSAATIYDGEVVYLSPQGLLAFSPLATSDNLNAMRRFSLLLERLLNPDLVGAGAALHKDAYGKCALWQHGGCLYLAAPGSPSDTENTVIYRWDGRQQSWSRWTCGDVTGGCAIETANEHNEDYANEHYVAGRDGMIYRFVNSAGDKATSGASATAVPFALTTRHYGTMGEQDPARFRIKRPHRFLVDVENGDEAVTLTLGLTGRGAAAAWSQNYSLDASGGGMERRQINVRPAVVQGDTFYAALAGSAAKGFRIYSLAVRASVGTDR